MSLIDTSQVTRLAGRLSAAAIGNQVKVAAAVKKGAQNIKEAIQADVRSSSNKAMRRVPIHYDIKSEGARIEADIGPQKGGAGDLANILFFGTAKGGGRHEFYGHGEDELDETAKYVGKAASGL